MDNKSMSEGEAFGEEFSRVHGRYPNPYSLDDMGVFELWKAACKYQRNKDAEICYSRTNHEWPNDDISMEARGCAADILNQGSKDETS